MVAMDMDGTLLRPDGSLSEETAAQLRELHAAGVGVCLATGRPSNTIRMYIRQLNLGAPIPTVCFNGACAMMLSGDPAAEEAVLFTRALDADVTAR